MKILHTCLAAFYIDNYSYQENILPKLHKNLGLEVSILASTETYSNNIEITYLPQSSYNNENEISVTRISYVKWLPLAIVKKLRIYKGINKVLNDFKPDIIFLHDCQFLSINSFVNYSKKNKVLIYVDCHTDLINSGRSWISENILHKIIYKYCVKTIEPYVKKFYGTLPLRNDFLEKVYGVSKSKIELLPFGVDDSLFDWNDVDKIRNQMRTQLKISENDFVLITGGKIDFRKNIHKLLEAFNNLVEKKFDLKLKLIVFGKPTIEMKEIINNLIKNSNIIYIDWLASKEIHRYFLASDLAIFPGTHSVLWEEAVGLGIPCVFLKWPGIEHVDLGGNCIFIDSSESKIIQSTVENIISEKAFLKV